MAQSSKTATRPKRGTGGTIDAPQAGALVPQAAPPPPDIDEVAAWMAFDAADEEQIVKEIVTGELVDALVYQFEMKNGSTVRGISYAGVNWCVREMALRGMGQIGLRSPLSDAVHVHEGANADGEPIYKAVVVAIDRKLGTENVGMADALRYPPKKGGGTYTDHHAERKALSKAQRNAKAGLIPELLKAELLERVTNVQIKRVKTDRQRAEEQANDAGQSRARRTQAAKPKPTKAIANASQQKLVMAKFKENGGPSLAESLDMPDEKLLLRVMLGWWTGEVHLDRVPKDLVDPLVTEGLPDMAATVDALVSYASEQGTTGDHKRAAWLLTELPALREVLKIPEPEQGEQQTLDGSPS